MASSIGFSTSSGGRPASDPGLMTILRTPSVTVDLIIELTDGKIVLIKRKNPPPGWALPGGFVDYGETLEAAAVREAKEETSSAARRPSRGMCERAWGRVVNTSSIGSLGNIGQANYAASKGGVIGLTRTLALEYAKYGVTVNAIAPGPVMTQMLASVPDQIKEKIIAQIPVGRIAAPEEIANVHALLASDEAAFITGQVIFVDGGMSVGV